MFLALLYSLIIHQSVVFANPYHKYPYVFLLDVGNEELQTNSEQIRVSVPGGSLALRIPAIGEGGTIAHVRVSGIDFDNDLKANMVDGGPGYKYVVIVFMANPGRAYDAVVTVSTLANEDIYTKSTNINPEALTELKNSYKEAEDSEDEDFNDSAENYDHKSEASNVQLPSASNFYDSAENFNANGKEDDKDNDDIHLTNEDYAETNDQNDNDDFYDAAPIAETRDRYDSNAGLDKYAEANFKYENEDYDDAAKVTSNSHGAPSESQDYAEAIDHRETEDYDEVPQAEKYSVNEEETVENNQVVRELDSNLYDKYNALRPHLYNYQVTQEANNAENEGNYNVDYKGNSVIYAPVDPVELDQMFNDEEVHNDREKINNYANADDNSAVAY